ncbi:MAG: homoserine dehydrogenase [Gemmatimonadaceae bacterium]|nr:homoserine dehydrogenase [Gemmatimonadaceae bacterium]MCW5826180.1 homoserine dehydrogenase [Gemmatimonadaceae bacterium]
MSRVISVALAGCGTVGAALLDLLDRHGPEIARRTGVTYGLTRVLVRDLRRPRALRLDRALLTDDADEFLATPADVVVEAIGGTTTAGTLARGALRRGRRLVTANKALLRVEGPALAALAQRHRSAGAALDFEAAVGGGVPIVRLLRDSLAGQGLHRIRGVLNGTTNFILSRVERGASFNDALRAAQQSGFAESDPTRDLDGTDAADKIAVLAWLGFGVDPSTIAVRTHGIGAELGAQAREAARRGRAIRLVATAVRVGDGVHCSVAPRVVPRGHPFAQVRDEQNLIQLESESTGTLTVAGAGAGGPATASALLADILRHGTSNATP